jgi:hypothetical protein
VPLWGIKPPFVCSGNSLPAHLQKLLLLLPVYRFETVLAIFLLEQKQKPSALSNSTTVYSGIQQSKVSICAARPNFKNIPTLENILTKKRKLQK